jgi:hypothetical protein
MRHSDSNQTCPSGISLREDLVRLVPKRKPNSARATMTRVEYRVMVVLLPGCYYLNDRARYHAQEADNQVKRGHLHCYGDS